MNKVIEIAKILKPQGIRGEVKAMPLSNVLAVFNSLKSCLVGDKMLEIEHLNIRQGFLYIKFVGVNTRNDAETLRNKFIRVEKELLENSKDEDEFLIDDLIGMVLYDDEGSLVGQIVDVENYGACDIFVIEKEGRQCQAPYVKDVFVKQGNTIVVNSQKFKEVVL